MSTKSEISIALFLYINLMFFENIYIKLHFTILLYCIYDHINAALVSINLLSKTLRKMNWIESVQLACSYLNLWAAYVNKLQFSVLSSHTAPS